MKKVELLSPAGNMESLYQAVAGGADAVYLGGKKFGARKFAGNFDNNELIEAIKYCHLYGVKIYVTVNTIVFENELEEVIKYIRFLHENNVDALIVQDTGIIKKIKNIFPNLELHASTQCHNHNESSVKAIKKLGASRVVLARELSLDEIKKINVDIEKEVFIHGALCVSYSGCCLFSSLNGGRSGNRGECVGSCRLCYKLHKNNDIVKTEGDYLLSTKSLCTIQNIKEMIESGITSFKIEGRMKSPEYIGYVTRLYREKIDLYYANKEVEVSNDEINNLKKLYNRGFTSGYLFGCHGKDLMNIKTSNHIGIPLGKIVSIDSKKIKILLSSILNQEDGIRFDDGSGMIINKLYNDKDLLVSSVSANNIAVVDNKIGLISSENVRKTSDYQLLKSLEIVKSRKVLVSLSLEATIGNPLCLTIDDGDNVITEYGSFVQESINSPTSKERIKKQIEKLGNTPFKSLSTIINADDNIFISIKELNELRRMVTDKLIEKREFSVPHLFLEKKEEVSSSDKKEHNQKENILKLNVLARNEKQVKSLLDMEINNIYITDYAIYKKYKKNPKVYYRTKRVTENNDLSKTDNILATELGAITDKKANNIVSDYYLNVVNTSSISYLLSQGVNLITLSVENDFENIKLLNNFDKLELFVYGRAELMVLKYCPINMIINNDNKKCNLCQNSDNYTLEDQYGNNYPVLNEKHLTHILHYKPINLIDSIKEYKRLGIINYRIELFDEEEDEIVKIIKEIKSKYE